MRSTRLRATNVPPLTHQQSDGSSAWATERYFHDQDGWRVYPDSTLQEWWVSVDVEHRRTFINPETWETISGDPDAFISFIWDHTKGGESGMRFIVQDSGVFGTAARRQAEAKGTDVPVIKDRLATLIDTAQRFVVQAASLNMTATAGQARAFALRYARLREELAMLEAELGTAQGLVNLAGTALVDATLPAPPPLRPLRDLAR